MLESTFIPEFKDSVMKTILVVEDFLHARHLICKKLQGKGYNTVDAATVEEAY